jgi:hypothetical protein
MMLETGCRRQIQQSVDKRWENEDKRQEIGDRRQETGDRRLDR